MGKKESRIVTYLEHSPIRVGDKIVLETIGKKPPRMTIEEVATRVEQVAMRVEMVATKVEELATRVDSIAMTVEKLAQIVHNGFSNVNARLDVNDARWVKQEEFNQKLITRIDNLVVKNNLIE